MGLRLQDNRAAFLLEPVRPGPTSKSIDESKRRRAGEPPQDDLDERPSEAQRGWSDPFSIICEAPERKSDRASSDRNFQIEMAVAEETLLHTLNQEIHQWMLQAYPQDKLASFTLGGFTE